MLTMPNDMRRIGPAGAARGGALSANARAVFSRAFLLCSVFLLTSCIAGLQGSPLSSLPKVETSPPAKFTKGAPAYTMLFHTVGAFASPSSSVPMSMGDLMSGAVSGLMGGGGSRIVSLRVVSHPGPVGGLSPRAYHMIPPAMNMGEYLPLLPPVREAAPSRESGPAQGSSEKPERIVIKIYWGCGENVRQGQPRVIDTGKMKNFDMPAMGSYAAQGGKNWRGGGGGLKSGWVEAEWPNKEDSRTVPDSASLVGGHFLHGNFLPHIRFEMGARHDIMEKLALNAEKQSLKEAIPITWNKLPTAIGYHLTAFAYSDARKEMVVWTSSENPNVNVGGQFLDTPTVRKHIAAKVILPADRDRCIIPRGIFDGMDMVMVSGTAWGEDYWASEPPRPANPPKNWKPDWVVKGQFLSTDFLMLGTSASGSGGSGGSGGGSGLGSILRGIF